MSVQSDLDLLDFYDDDNEDEEELLYFYDDKTNFEKLKLRDMSDTGHEWLKNYLVEVIRWLFRVEGWAVYAELNFYETTRFMEEPLYPDIALLKTQQWERMRSYQLGVRGVVPDLTIEIVSENTRRKDLYTKPKRYARWGVAEYFVYDNRVRRRGKNKRRLWGWRLNESKTYDSLTAEKDGRIWSEQLDCWLVPDGEYLRVYSKAGQIQLTEAQALAQQNKLINQKLAESELFQQMAEKRSEFERRKAQEARQLLEDAQARQLEIERQAQNAQQQADLERRKAQEAQQQAEVERLRAERLADALRKMGINPDEFGE